MDTPTPYFQAGVHTFKGFYDENAITEDLLFDMTGTNDYKSFDALFISSRIRGLCIESRLIVIHAMLMFLCSSRGG